MSHEKRASLRLLALCYGIALLAYLAACAFGAIAAGLHRANGALARQPLPLSAFAMDDIMPQRGYAGGDRLVSTGPDPKFVYEPGTTFYADRITLSATPHKPAGEITLYYTTTPGAPFSENHKLWAQQAPDGTWYFDLGGRKIAGFRIDTGTAPGVIWQMDGIVLNENHPLTDSWLPDWRGALLLLLAPLLGYALLRELGTVLYPVWARRAAHRRAAKRSATPPHPR